MSSLADVLCVLNFCGFETEYFGKGLKDIRVQVEGDACVLHEPVVLKFSDRQLVAVLKLSDLLISRELTSVVLSGLPENARQRLLFQIGRTIYYSQENTPTNHQ